MVALMAGDLTEASRLAGEDLTRYDSVQFPLFAPRPGHWMAESFTEIVILRHAERAPLSTRVAGRRIGSSGTAEHRSNTVLTPF